MLRTRLRIDGQAFLLPGTVNIDQLKQELMTAVQVGAAFVNFDTHSHGQVSVLMTPHIPVRFESMEKTDDEAGEWVDSAPTFDLDGFTAH